MEVESVFVTGSNRGLGLYFVKSFLQLPRPPRHIFAACRNPDDAKELQDLKGEFEETTTVHILQLDVLEESQLSSCVEYVTSIVEDKGLTLLINNAGIMPHLQFPNISYEEYVESFKVNAVAPMIIAQAFLDLLKSSAAGHENQEKLSVERAAILNMCTSLGTFDFVNVDVWAKVDTYRMSKVATHMGSVIQARELLSSGILVLMIHPGWVSTDMGGSLAPMTPEESVGSIMNIMANAGPDQHGCLIDYEGQPLAW